MLQPSQNVRTLRSSGLDQQHVPLARAVVDSRAFSVATPRLWNELPLKIALRKQKLVSGRN